MGYRTRKNIRELEEAYKNGNKKELSDLIRAWSGIQKLDPTDKNSFFYIAGFHGEPFRGAGYSNPQWWGGYCNHGNVLFPTWHRAYLYYLENALRSIPGCEDVTLPYWDETEAESLVGGIPWALTQDEITLDDGSCVKNPLKSYTFQAPVWDNLTPPTIVTTTTGGNPGEKTTAYVPNPNYYKDKNYETVRYPFSGLTSEGNEAEITTYNDQLKTLTEEQLTGILNTNVTLWLTDKSVTAGHATALKFAKCLDAPNYTVFSNTTSAQEWNERNLDVQSWGPGPDPSNPHGQSPDAVVPLESPHNDMHLAVGGFNYPGEGDENPDPKYDLANGDMGENETASFDPIFYFHHCWIDKTFWDWQSKWDSKQQTKTKLSIIDGYPGTNSVDNQGPTPGVAGGTWLSLSDVLTPFPQTSNEVVDIEGQLGYTYTEFHNPETPKLGKPHPADVQFHAKVQGVNRGKIGGSFVVAVNKVQDGKKTLMGYESILSRWHTAGCANCQTHLNVKAFIPLPGVKEEHLKDPNISFEAVVHPRVRTHVDEHGNKKKLTLIGGNAVPSASLKVVQTAK